MGSLKYLEQRACKKILVCSGFFVYLHHQISRKFPAKHSIKHIRWLSKAMTGHCTRFSLTSMAGQLFDIQMAIRNVIIV